MNKQSVRDLYLKLRLALSDSEYRQLSQNLCSNFFSLIDLSGVTIVHVYLPMISKKEPDTWLIIDRLKNEFPHIRTTIPKIDGGNRLINYYFTDKQQVMENKWGIPEPGYGDVTPTEKIDLVIVPLLAFDQIGNRVGYGKGYYDRFLKGCRPDCKKIGLSFFNPVKEISDLNNNDIRLDGVITPSQLWRIS